MASRKRLVILSVIVFSGLMLGGCGPSAAEKNLIRAVQDGDAELVKTLLTENPKLANAKDDSYALMHAIWARRMDILDILLEKGGDINVKDDRYGRSPLHYAVAELASRDMVDYLVSKGANVNAKDKLGRTPLYYIVSAGYPIGKRQEHHWEIARFLISKGADVNVTAKSGSTILSGAAFIAPKDIVLAIIERGADVNLKVSRDYMQTPLHAAISREDQDFELVELLVAEGANINDYRAGHGTPLHLASLDGHTNAVELLTGKGADVQSKKDPFGRGDTPLHLAANAEIAELLVTRGADVNARNKLGRTPLHVATAEGRKEVVELLIAKGADVNARDESGQAPMAHTEEMAELLRKHSGQ